MVAHYLEFERPIADLEAKIEELSKLSETTGSGAMEGAIEALRTRAPTLRREAYSKLDARQKTLVARHPARVGAAASPWWCSATRRAATPSPV